MKLECLYQSNLSELINLPPLLKSSENLNKIKRILSNTDQDKKYTFSLMFSSDMFKDRMELSVKYLNHSHFYS